MKGPKGPDLTTVGAKHTRDWIMEHVRNPKAHKPGSRMPPYEGKMDDAALAALGDFLASQK
jgi:cbb3-type cytochrome oxidase cytochrome c subunit